MVATKSKAAARVGILGSDGSLPLGLNGFADVSHRGGLVCDEYWLSRSIQYAFLQEGFEILLLPRHYVNNQLMVFFFIDDSVVGG